MKTDAALRVEAMETLISRLGEVDAERFVTIIKTDNFDYTQWRQGLWADKSLEDIHDEATLHATQPS